MSYWSGRVGRCFWSCIQGDITDADVAAFVGGIQRIGESALPELVVLDITHGINRPNAMHRKRITDAVQVLPNKERIRGHAVVADSSVARGVLTIVNWFVKPVFPERVFENPNAALAWLKEHDATLDEVRVLEDVGETVASFQKLRW